MVPVRVLSSLPRSKTTLVPVVVHGAAQPLGTSRSTSNASSDSTITGYYVNDSAAVGIQATTTVFPTYPGLPGGFIPFRMRLPNDGGACLTVELENYTSFSPRLAVMDFCANVFNYYTMDSNFQAKYVFQDSSTPTPYATFELMTDLGTDYVYLLNKQTGGVDIMYQRPHISAGAVRGEITYNAVNPQPGSACPSLPAYYLASPAVIYGPFTAYFFNTSNAHLASQDPYYSSSYAACFQTGGTVSPYSYLTQTLPVTQNGVAESIIPQ
jgi:hypothetical protein